MGAVPVKRHQGVRWLPDARRVIAKPFLPGEEVFPDGRSRIEVVVRRILAMAEGEVAATLRQTLEGFGYRHRDLDGALLANLALVADRVELPETMSEERKRLIGAYFTHEYSIEAAALGNPSMVVGPDQSGLRAGETRFVMSLRAIGEGHISSIEFRTGVVGPSASITLDQPSRFASTGARASAVYDRAFFETKLRDLGALNELALQVLADLDPHFTLTDLEVRLRSLFEELPDSSSPGVEGSVALETSHILHWLASSNYHVGFEPSGDISERVIFPGGPTESRGMEDVRLVRFVHDDGRVVYYGTYTAFDGHQILPQLLETTDFVTFRVATLSGACAQNKGIALFPRKLNGHFMALGRHDNVNNFLMTSPDVRVWRETKIIQEPERPWELTQLGNCGSPIETDAGWLVITHGVGPFRRYTLGALLLDLDDPSKVIGHLKEPLLEPAANEREGYVPNVVYSCGSMLHGRHLVLPFGFADVGASVATIDLRDLLGQLMSG
jgi:predicted GH43/DUF377 family glycosyl hydrolase